jgi:glycosyltransferase involved in cell wall biosynthesis
MKISVIIPTYQRPKFLKETLESVWAQTVLPDEIIIGDDSKDDLTENLVINQLIKISPVPIRYFHHKPSLLEVKNVDFQYLQAIGDLVLHLHDDDPIYPNCIEDLKKPFLNNNEIIASFGLQRMIYEDGSLCENAENVNEFYFRTADRAGIVDPFIAGTTAMFPNNGFLVRRDYAISIGYSDRGRAGKATDFYFGFRLGQLGLPFYFVYEYTASCRIVLESQSRQSGADNSFRRLKILFEDCNYEQLLIPEINNSIKNIIPIAITCAAKQNHKLTALKWLISKYYRNNILSPRGIKKLLLIINPF